ncbi:cytochrome P450 [Melanogaster broomeanus]|nr:cytochrome P450 [Melanogaster broomeanus]
MWLALDFCLAGLALYLVGRLRKNRLHPLPPGPSGWPLIGNLLDIPSQMPWIVFGAMSKKYGHILSLNILGTQFIVINGMEAANDILEKKSSISSDRPHHTMGGDLVGWGNSTFLQQYGERHRQHRKFFHRQIGSRSSIATFYPAEEEETRRFLCNVLNQPDDLVAHIRRAAGAIILKISHGYSVKDGDDPFVETADRAMHNFSEVTAVGAFLVDFIPILWYLPEWFPGARFQRDAKRWRKLVTDAATKPHEFVLEHLAKGDAAPSFTSKLLRGGVTPEEEDLIKWASFSMYLAYKWQQTVSAIHAFFLAMTIYPEIFQTAQAEIDTQIGSGRLPTFEDRDSLPYVNAICKELLRWNVVAPLGMPFSGHVATQDDTYKGFLIPKGSNIVGNIWQIMYDAETYPEPEVFRPERFLGDNVQPDPRNVCFGWGRRICPGLHLADASIFITVAMSLATLDISRHVEDGVEVAPRYEVVGGVVCHPKPFKCRITPRSKTAQDLLRV